jgi:predicted acetyltransferase
VNDAGEAIGFTQVRHRPSCAADLPPEAANHIYYEIAEAHRGRGYGKAILALALVEARRIGLEAVRIGAAVSNVASTRIIRANGGVLVAEVVAGDGEPIRLYEVRLGAA